MERKGGSFKTRVRMQTMRRQPEGGSGRRQRARRGAARRKQKSGARSGWRCRVGPRGPGRNVQGWPEKAVAMAMRPGKVAAARAKVMGTIFKGRAEAGQDQKAR